MKPTFINAIKYRLEVECVSPLRTGASDNDQQTVLHTWDGSPMVQGTSFAGSMLEWAKDSGIDVDRLFGSQAGEGELAFSDIVFEQTDIATRPRLKIDGKTGTAENHLKFDTAAIPTGTKGSAKLIWRGNRSLEEGEREVESCLAAINSNEIRFGAQKTNGFGCVKLKVFRKTFSMEDASQRQEWIDDKEAVIEIIPAALYSNKAKVRFSVTAQTPALLVKESVGEGIGFSGTDAVNMSENGQKIIPGSSIKGAIRAQIDRISKKLGMESETDEIFGCSNGSESGKAGIVLFSDGYFSGPNLKKITRIRIDRFTGGVLRGALFSEEPVSGQVTWEILVPAADEKACALILFALRDLGLKQFSLGGNASIGRGYFKHVTVQCECRGKHLKLECGDGKAELSDRDGIAAQWLKSLEVKGK